jgi:hypothetical protein
MQNNAHFTAAGSVVIGFRGNWRDLKSRNQVNKNFSGYKNREVISGKYWEFEAGNATCFRIAHPRATHGHGEFRD